MFVASSGVFFFWGESCCSGSQVCSGLGMGIYSLKLEVDEEIKVKQKYC